MTDMPSWAREGIRHVFVRDMVLPASIGVYPHEQDAKQRVRLNLDLAVGEGPFPAVSGLSRAPVGRDDLARVVDYEAVVRRVRAVVAAGHVMLVETLAERLAETCFDDPRTQAVRVRVEKLDVFVDVASVGVEIERRRSTCPPPGIDSQ